MEKLSENLWSKGFIKKVEKKTPKTILKEQASFLGKETKNILTAEVHTKLNKETNYFEHKFRIYAPLLSNYTFVLFSVNHKLENLYPVSVYFDVVNNEEKPTCVEEAWDEQANTEEEFKQKLKEILTHYRTRSILNSLISQSE